MSESLFHITKAAADKIFSLIQEEKNPNLALRVYITGGGCSGFQYGFSFDDNIAEDDSIFTQTCSNNSDVIQVTIDPMSYPFLKDATIDYVEDIHGEQFVIENPHAKTTCGCGSSFNIEE